MFACDYQDGLLEGVPALGLLTALLVSRGPGLVDPAVGEPTWTPAGASVVEEAMIPPAAAVVAALVASSPWPSPEEPSPAFELCCRANSFSKASCSASAADMCCGRG